MRRVLTFLQLCQIVEIDDSTRSIHRVAGDVVDFTEKLLDIYRSIKSSKSLMPIVKKSVQHLREKGLQRK